MSFIRNYEREMAVMDMHDAGASNDEIARAMGVSSKRVLSIIGNMSPGRADYLASRPVVTASSDKLLAAIASHHPERIPQRNAA